MDEYSTFRTTYQVVTAIGLIVFLPLFSWLGCSDSLILLFATLSQIAGRVTFGLADTPKIFFLGRKEVYTRKDKP